MRLGVDAAVVDGTVVSGDVEVVEDAVASLGLPPAGTGRLAVPGFVDLQVNGFAGVDFLRADEQAIFEAGRALLATGVTAYLPTLITAAIDDVVSALGRFANLRRGTPDVAQILGVHVEGPFLSPDRLGTHPAEHRRDPDLGVAQRYLDAGPVRYVTLAPELPGALELIDRLHAAGVTVAIGHSNATAAQASAAFDRGVRTVTHLFNAMRHFTPRDPGIAGAALAHPEVVVQVIVDGHHLAAETVQLVWRAAAGRVAVVTDAVAAAGVGDGAFMLGDVPVQVSAGAVRRADGTLAGSALTMVEAVRNLVALGVDLGPAVDAATRVPASVLGRSDLGRLAVGSRADIVLLGEDLEVVGVLLAGQPIG